MKPLELALAFVFGVAFGSFANVAVFRVPRGFSVVSPGSLCPGCEQPIAWYDNIPLASFLILRAKCERCGLARDGLQLGATTAQMSGERRSAIHLFACPSCRDLAPARPANPLHDQVYSLKDSGKTVFDICSATGLEKGEVELILGLRNMRS